LNPRVTEVVTVLILWGMFLVSLVLPLALGLFFLATGALFMVLNRARLDKVTLILLLNISYWLFSGLLVGSISPRDLLSPQFFNGDGRILIGYSPLLLFGAAAIQWSNVDLLVKTLFHIALAALFFFAVWFVTGASFLSEGMAGNYVGFMTSHTGGGTFFGALAVFLILFGHLAKNRIIQITGWLMLIPMLAASSRSSILAFLAVSGWYIVKMRNPRVIAGGALALILVTASIPVLFPHTWNRTLVLFDPALVTSLVEQIEASEEFEPTIRSENEDRDWNLVGPQHNVLARVMFWSYAVRRFIQSPIFGIGFGRYNDGSLELSGIDGFVYMAFGGQKRLGAGSAHNSYLHILCESGLLGLALLLWLWSSIYFRLQAGSREFQNWRDMHALMVASQGLVVFGLFAALAGHALAAPSLMLMIATVVGVALAAQRSFGARPG